jgi:hypothetical protein
MTIDLFVPGEVVDSFAGPFTKIENVWRLVIRSRTSVLFSRVEEVRFCGSRQLFLLPRLIFANSAVLNAKPIGVNLTHVSFRDIQCRHCSFAIFAPIRLLSKRLMPSKP